MKHFVIEIMFCKDLEEVDKVLPFHREFLKDGYAKGIYLMSGPKNPREGGIIIARSESKKELEEFCSKDPYQKNGVAIYRFIEFNPVMFNDAVKDWIE